LDLPRKTRRLEKWNRIRTRHAAGVLQRYAIVEEGMLHEAGARLTQGAKSKVTRSRGKVINLAR
jgi:hypothetical protein